MENNSGLGTKLAFDMERGQSNVIKVIGVGGGGSNAINYMFNQSIKGVDFIICNTDSQALENSPVPTKIQLGVNLTEGLGAGANPEIGSLAAQESIEEIDRVLDKNTKMVFITAGMGGGTGTGAAPVIAELAKNKDILTVGIVTIPFQFEGKIRHEQALLGVERLRKHVDSLIVINNNKLREVYGNLGFKAGYAKSDEVLTTASRGIAEVISQHYTMNIDLRDAKTVLSNSGTAIMGSATASGENRAKDAVVAALDSPLLNENRITGAKNVLLLIVCGTEMEDEITIDEIGEINDYIQNESGHNANIIMGVGNDEKLGNSVSVTVIATGFNFEQQSELINKDNVIKHMLGAEQSVTQELNLTPGVKSVSSNSSLTNAVVQNNLDKAFDVPAVKPVPEKRIVHVLDADLEKPQAQVTEPIANVVPEAPVVNELDSFFDIVAPENLDFPVSKPTPQIEIKTVQSAPHPIKPIEVVKPNLFEQKLSAPSQPNQPENNLNFELKQQPSANTSSLFLLNETIQVSDEVAPAEPQIDPNFEVEPKLETKQEDVVKHILNYDYLEQESALTNAKPVVKAETKLEDKEEDPDLQMTVRVEKSVPQGEKFLRNPRKRRFT
ncbi:cell division protein FtsZ [Flavobacterium agricola]|uniref:Cell division protein FtsZ n=1 Tax=Flavobacterium agricola TaxID=2870839 RepID=A0ABY6LWE2_9FLAO|nr:cell division protein FtsZ [Flavobacterium agricola]UYW00650.1 cell division protein FtsZ [Flavobacterium agricola]